MSLSNIKKSQLLTHSDSVTAKYKGWEILVTGAAPYYEYSLSVFTGENSDEGVYGSLSGSCKTIEELKEEIRHEVSSIGYTAREVAEWHIKLGNGVRTYEELEESIIAYENQLAA